MITPKIGTRIANPSGGDTTIAHHARKAKTKLGCRIARLTVTAATEQAMRLPAFLPDGRKRETLTRDHLLRERHSAAESRREEWRALTTKMLAQRLDLFLLLYP